MNDYPQESRSKALLVGGVVAISLILVAGWSLFKFFPSFLPFSESETEIDPQNIDNLSLEREFNTAVKNTDARIFDKAILELENVGSNSSNNNLRIEAEIHRANNLFSQRAEHPEYAKMAIDILKDIEADEDSTPFFKARAINLLLGFYYKDRDSDTFYEIFSTEPYLSILEEVGPIDAPRALSELSVSYYPAPRAQLRIARWYSGNLVNDRMFSDVNLSDNEKKDHIQKIKDLITDTEESFIKENQDTPGEDRPRVFASFYHHRGFNYAALALSGEDSFQQSFELDFVKTLNIFDAAIESGEEDYSGLTAQIVPYTHMYYAFFLNDIYGQERLEDIKKHIHKSIEVSNSDYRENLNEFKKFISVTYNQSKDDPLRRDYNYKILEKIISLDEDFAEFARTHGWSE